MRLALVQRMQPGYSAQVLASVLGDVERQVNNLTEGKVKAVTNASTAAPTGTTQPYNVGDFVRKSDPVEVTAAGVSYVIIGYICTVAGSPGTWEECRVLTADPASVPITVADAAGDTSTWVLLGGSQTGAQQPLSDGGLTYNANTNVLTASGGFVGNLTGDVTGNVSGNAGTLTVANEATDTTCFIGFYTAASGSLPGKTNTNMTFNSSTGVVTFASSVLTTTDINGGTVDGTTIGASSASTGAFTTISATGQVTSTLATGTAPFSIASTTRVANLNVAQSGLADTVTVADAAADTTTWPMVATSQTGNLAPATDAGLTYNASTNVLDVTGGYTTAATFTSSVATGTAPLVITSTTRVSNLNVARSGVADTVTVADAASDTTTWPLVATSQTGDLSPATDANYTYNASTNQLSVGGTYAVSGTQVITSRQTGWGTPSSTLLRTTFATYAGITFANSTYSGLFTDLQTLDDHVKGLSQRLGALITDLITHGLIGA